MGCNVASILNLSNPERWLLARPVTKDTQSFESKTDPFSFSQDPTLNVKSDKRLHLLANWSMIFLDTSNCLFMRDKATKLDRLRQIA